MYLQKLVGKHRILETIYQCIASASSLSAGGNETFGWQAYVDHSLLLMTKLFLDPN